MVRGTNPTSSAVYSIELEAQAQTWIEEVTGEAFQGEFAEELRDGRRLCNLVNAIKPGFVRRVNNSPGMPFKQMENISNFLKACRVVGVPEYSLFETVDLFELKDLGIVVKCLHALGGTVQLNCPDFKGPHLGLKPLQKSPLKLATAAKAGLTATSGQAGLRSSSSRYGVAPANSPLPSVSTPTEVPLSPQASPVRTQSPSPVYDSSAPSSPCFDASAGDGSIATIPSVNGAAVAQLPPPPFDESAARWGSGERKKPQLPPPAVVGTGTSGGGERLPPPAYREINSGSPPAKTTSVAATAKPDDVSSRFSQAVRVEDSCATGSVSPNARGSGDGSRSVPQVRPAPASTLPKPTAFESSQQAQQGQGQGRSVASVASTVNVSAKSPSASLSPSRSPSRSPPRSEKAATSPQLSPRSVASSAASRPGPSSTVRGGGYGLDAELAARREATYDHQAEREAQDWIEDVTGEPFVDEFAEELKSGRRLCELINSIKPGAVRRVNDSRMPFKQMENISNFLKACRAVGVTEYSLFETVDLFEGKDIGLVVRCLHALGQTVQKSCPEYDGPRLGIKQTDSNKREWTTEQQRQQVLQSSGAMSQLMAGSSKTMERGVIIKEGVTFGASTSGTGDASASALWTMGSQATMERTNVSKSGPTFGAEYAGAASATGSSSRVTRGCR